MNLATSTTVHRTRKPRLRVIGGDLRPARHRVIYHRTTGSTDIIEFWTPAEWASLAEWERPANVGFLPGVGFIALTPAESQAEVAEVRDEHHASIAQWRVQSGHGELCPRPEVARAATRLRVPR